jgi:hypothetical protein
MVEIVSNIAGSNSATYTRQYHFDSDRMAGTIASWGSKNENTDIQNIQSMQPHTQSGNHPTLSFGEFVDVVNPLHHIPIVNTIYRNLTGDTISPVAKIMGGGIYGGPIGAATSIAMAAIDEHGGGANSVISQAFNSASTDASTTQEPSQNQWRFNN